MIQHQSHIVHAFDQDLLDLRVKISELFEQAEKQLGDALTALSERDQELAHHIMKQDHTANQLESEIDNQIIEIIALRQPMAIDLRFLMTAIKVGVDLERIADKAKSIAKSVPYLPLANHHDALIGSIVDLGSSVSGMLSKSAKAYLDSDLDLARAVIEADYDVDELFHTIFHQCFALLTSGGIDSRIITRLVLVVKCLERIGDHSKNIAQHAFYAEQGHYPPRPQKYVDRVRARRDLQGESQGLHPARILIYLNPAEQVQQADTYSGLLQQAGHLVQVVDDHSAVINAISQDRFDLVILGWQMHGGAELVKDVRSKVSSAILVLDEGGEDINAIAALEAGADEYLKIPVPERRLHLQINSLLSRLYQDFEQKQDHEGPNPASSERNDAAFLVHGDLWLDTSRQLSGRGDNPLKLSPTEFAILQILMQEPQAVFSRDQILEAIRGKHVHVGIRTIDVHIKRLRASLRDAADYADAPDPIRTVRSRGYALR